MCSSAFLPVDAVVAFLVSLDAAAPTLEHDLSKPQSVQDDHVRQYTIYIPLHAVLVFKSIDVLFTIFFVSFIYLHHLIFHRVW